ncbi:cytidylate kinase [Tepiditoga spiralis]|uniref:Cytidylate kinase n=1 Tax=Tepiditoga spiralis TaxID=2108365 RepID=A0A7G1G5B4_9BACT|nr:(d)CMP kinase [Tepiditoga spiralis]BBE30466.1 cytidylate kinase [Tepiditoga spiralis]
MIHIAIDGPAGSGKSTIAKKVAEKFNINYLDSGALYRIIGYYIFNENINLEDANGIVNSLGDIDIILSEGKYRLNGKLIDDQIRTYNSGKLASRVAKIPEVRKKVNYILKSISSKESTVIDGRDIGTVVLPKAEVKIYLTASAKERANRRYKELIEKGEKVNFEDVYTEIKKRDEADTNRTIAPLKPAEDAKIIDTTGKKIEEVLSEIYTIVESELKNGNKNS